MDAQPLTDPSGRVMAWACGRCHRVGGGSSLMGYDIYDDDAVSRIAGWSHRDADRCCVCRRCGGPCEQGFDSRDMWTCKACWSSGAKEESEARIAAIRAKQEAEDTAREAFNREALKASPDPDAALRLRHEMREWSEDEWRAGWLSGLDDTLQDRIAKGDESAQVGVMAALVKACGGIWRWNDDLGGEVFVRLEVDHG